MKMHIRLNNDITELPGENMTIAELLAWKNIPTQGTAVALNGRLAPRSPCEVTKLKDNDDVVISSAAYGG